MYYSKEGKNLALPRAWLQMTWKQFSPSTDQLPCPLPALPCPRLQQLSCLRSLPCLQPAAWPPGEGERSEAAQPGAGTRRRGARLPGACFPGCAMGCVASFHRRRHRCRATSAGLGLRMGVAPPDAMGEPCLSASPPSTFAVRFCLTSSSPGAGEQKAGLLPPEQASSPPSCRAWCCLAPH